MANRKNLIDNLRKKVIRRKPTLSISSTDFKDLSDEEIKKIDVDQLIKTGITINGKKINTKLRGAKSISSPKSKEVANLKRRVSDFSKKLQSYGISLEMPSKEELKAPMASIFLSKKELLKRAKITREVNLFGKDIQRDMPIPESIQELILNIGSVNRTRKKYGLEQLDLTKLLNFTTFEGGEKLGQGLLYYATKEGIQERTNRARDNMKKSLVAIGNDYPELYKLITDKIDSWSDKKLREKIAEASRSNKALSATIYGSNQKLYEFIKHDVLRFYEISNYSNDELEF